jgi:hypothetical protein
MGSMRPSAGGSDHGAGGAEQSPIRRRPVRSRWSSASFGGLRLRANMRSRPTPLSPATGSRFRRRLHDAADAARRISPLV